MFNSPLTPDVDFLQTDRYLDGFIVDSDVVQLKPDAPHFDFWGHSGSQTGHLRGRQDGAML